MKTGSARVTIAASGDFEDSARVGVVWYFARGDDERGPFTEPQMRSLIGAGRVLENDLVWKEGMPDWVCARDVPGLVAPSPPGESAASADSDVPLDSEPIRTPSARQATRQPTAGLDPFLMRVVGFAVFALGLAAVMGAKGCESLGRRYADRLEAMTEISEKEFTDKWSQRKQSLEREQANLRRNGATAPANNARLQQITLELSRLDADRDQAREQLEVRYWRSQRRTAQQARFNERLWGFVRQITFYAGATGLAIGLLILGVFGVGPERWMALGVLGALAFSLLMGGSAWT